MRRKAVRYDKRNLKDSSWMRTVTSKETSSVVYNMKDAVGCDVRRQNDDL